MFNIYDLIIASFVLATVAFVFNHINIRRIAAKAAKRHCEQHDLQWLDQNVVLKSLRLVRSPHQLFAFERSFHFEFSSVGDHRYSGRVRLLGKRLQQIELDIYKT